MTAHDLTAEIMATAEIAWEPVRALVDGIVEVRLNGVVVFFIPFEPPMAPPFPADAEAWEDVEEWRTPADARLGFFFHAAEIVVTPYDPLADQELRFPTFAAMRGYGVGGHGRAPQPGDGVVFYTSADRYRELTAERPDRGSVPVPPGADRANRPVVDFLVQRLERSRLVPDGTLRELGLTRRDGR